MGVHDDKKVWLEEAEFECDWYWGIGYIAMFNSTYTDICESTHFDYLFFSKGKDCYTLFDEYFDDIVLTEKDVWKLLELMNSLYIMRNYSDLCISAFPSSNTVFSLYFLPLHVKSLLYTLYPFIFFSPFILLYVNIFPYIKQ